MNPDILIPILTLSAISVGAGVLLDHFGNSDKYDERQLVERGRAAGLAMNIAISYLIGIFAGLALGVLPVEYMEVFAVYGLTVTLLAHTGYCIFHDAHLTEEQDAVLEGLKYGALGGVCLVLVVFNHRGIEWIQLALALDYVGTAVMLLLRALILRLREKRDE